MKPTNQEVKQNINKDHPAGGEILTGRSAVLFILMLIIFISAITKVRIIYLIFFSVIVIGVFHKEIHNFYLFLAGYF